MHSQRCELQQIYRQTPLLLCPVNFFCLTPKFERYKSCYLSKVEVVCVVHCQFFPNKSVWIYPVKLNILLLLAHISRFFWYVESLKLSREVEKNKGWSYNKGFLKGKVFLLNFKLGYNWYVLVWIKIDEINLYHGDASTITSEHQQTS